MKHKYKVGDKVVYIYWYDSSYQIHNDKIYNLISVVYSDNTHYFIGQFDDPVDEENLYTPAEALEFITNYINKTEE